MSRNFVSKIMAGTIALTPVSCIKKEPLHQITDKNIHPIIERVDSFAKSKANKIKLTATSEKKVVKKTPKERVQKENPTKELIIATIAKALENLDIKDLTIENKAKLITFSLNNEDFKVDLVQKRKKKEEK